MIKTPLTRMAGI